MSVFGSQFFWYFKLRIIFMKKYHLCNFCPFLAFFARDFPSWSCSCCERTRHITHLQQTHAPVKERHIMVTVQPCFLIQETIGVSFPSIAFSSWQVTAEAHDS